MIRNGLTRNSSRLSRSNSGTSVSILTSASSLSFPTNDRNVFRQISPFCNANETDRLLTNQGLITPKERTSTLSRRIRDKSYYKGLIHLKSKEISGEMKKLQKEVSLLSIDQSMYLPYKKKAESKAKELQNLQKILANYNLVEGMLNSDMQLNEAKEEQQNLKEDNEKENAEVEKLFDMTKKQEIIIKELETDLSQENYVTEILTTTTNPQLREKYKKLKRIEEELLLARLTLEEKLKDLKKERMNLENQCNVDEYLKKGLKIARKIWQQEDHKDVLLSEKTFNSELEEKEYLQKYRTECNDLLKGMQRESRNLEIKIKDVTNELKKLGTENDNLYNERSEKHSKLKKKEIIIDEFLSSFSEQQLDFLTEQQQLQCKIVDLLKQISNNLGHFGSHLNIDFLNIEDNNLESKKQAEELKRHYLKVTSDLNEINSIEEKLGEELKILKGEIAIKEKEIPLLSRNEGVKESLKNKGKELLKKLIQMKKQKSWWNFILEDIQNRHDFLEDKLRSNETYVMLSNLEKRWHSLEKENFSIENFIALKNTEKSYLLVKEEVRKIYSELNKML